MPVNLNIGVGLTGRYIVEKRRRDGGVVERLEFDNLVLDVGWNNLKERLDGTAVYPQYLYLGTGSTEPSASDSGLEQVSETLPGKWTATSSLGGYLRGHSEADGWIWHQKEQVFEYGEGEAEGVWTELGLAFGDTYTEPYNRSLFRDENGDPVSLTILSDEYLTVTVMLRMYFRHEEVSGSFLHNGQSVGYTAFLTHYASNLNDYRGSVWYRGLPRYYGYQTITRQSDTGISYSNTNYSGAGMDDYTSTPYDSDLKSEMDYQMGPGTEYEIHGLHARFHSAGTGTQRSLALFIYFDTPIIKAEDEKLAGSFSIQYSRDTALLS